MSTHIHARQAVQGDYLSGIAYQAGVPLQQLLLDNLVVIKDLGAPLTGKRLQVCKASSGAASAAPLSAEAPTLVGGPIPTPNLPVLAQVGSPANGTLSSALPAAGRDPFAPQLRALLGIRAAIDRTGGLAYSWLEGNGAGGGYCTNFEGITCDRDGNVQWIILRRTTGLGGVMRLGGTLPAARWIWDLPRLNIIVLEDIGLAGTLPPDWGDLTQLQHVGLARNGITGPLPEEWAGLARLKVLLL